MRNKFPEFSEEQNEEFEKSCDAIIHYTSAFSCELAERLRAIRLELLQNIGELEKELEKMCENCIRSRSNAPKKDIESR